MMNKLFYLPLVLIVGAIILMATNTFEKSNKNSMELKKEIDSVSYSLGVNIGENLKQQGLDEINVDVMATAMKDVFEDGDLKITAEQSTMILQSYMQKAQQSAGQEQAQVGKKFLEENKKKEGVKTTSSGLQYKVIKEGTGATPSASDKVTVHYEGRLIDGKVFDSSYKRGEPATFPVNGVISGWTEALQLMKEGSKYTLYIPSELAYGERGAGGQIPPHSTLVFDVELIKVEKAD